MCPPPQPPYLPFPHLSSIGPLVICMPRTDTDSAQIDLWFCRPNPRLCSIFTSRPPGTSTTISHLSTAVLHRPPCDLHTPDRYWPRAQWFLGLRAKPPPLLDLFISASQHFNTHMPPFLQTSSTGPLATCMHQTKTKPMRIGRLFCRPKPHLCSNF